MSSCSYRSNGADGGLEQLDDRRTRADRRLVSGKSGHPTEGQGGGDRGGGSDTSGAGSAGMEGLRLMQLELSEEDQPVVVPYEEVRAERVERAVEKCRLWCDSCTSSWPYARENGVLYRTL